ncbi:uncharacterized protein BYT42DRAFT_566414 [Radiomyces spectabilis]|uniref:uncharacterized protein n=1 Tax=Radiomyces spectabilis TaxID=64574 RepID=UPI0022206C62|nr:uncharacterized protein BYT42DRAFT_566414 [Radiomyces spectabilis]KAI8381408.1 hypothetical protein BYT42DRAFT_566414 [Radiomyces spectabilis]
MSGFFAPGRSRTFMQFLSIDSEIFPLLAVVATTFGVAGYVAGAKVDSHFSKLVHLTPSGHPWSNEAEATQPEYKYKFYRHADPAQQSMVNDVCV